jgi:Fe2+ or Zn2+ uptake regulation protein
MTESYTARLHAQGCRMTPQRMAILQTLEDAERHLTPLEIFERTAHALPGITEATVYRTLNFLSAHSLILAAHIGNGQLVYETAARAHHHLICRRCGTTQDIEHDLLIQLFNQLQTKTGYEIDSLHMTFFGLCPDCRAE